MRNPLHLFAMALGVSLLAAIPANAQLYTTPVAGFQGNNNATVGQGMNGYTFNPQGNYGAYGQNYYGQYGQAGQGYYGNGYQIGSTFNATPPGTFGYNQGYNVYGQGAYGAYGGYGSNNAAYPMNNAATPANTPAPHGYPAANGNPYSYYGGYPTNMYNYGNAGYGNQANPLFYPSSRF